MRKMVVAVLQGAGYAVEEAGDGDEALEKAQDQGVRPGRHGPQHAAHGRRHAGAARCAALPAYDDVALIVLSTETGADLKAKGREAGATGWMAKPFDPQKMLTIVRQFID